MASGVGSFLPAKAALLKKVKLTRFPDGIWPTRAGGVVARLRALFKKADPAKEAVDINEAIEEVVILTQSEVRRNKVLLRMNLATNLPPVLCDRIQI